MYMGTHIDEALNWLNYVLSLFIPNSTVCNLLKNLKPSIVLANSEKKKSLMGFV